MPNPINEMLKPILPGKGATDYERYLRTDDLLSLQKTPEQMSHPDELVFQVVHQSSELMLKGAVWCLERAKDHLAKGEFPQAARLLRRAVLMLRFPLEELTVLETLSPYDYHIIRAGLGHGSGLDSPGFLALLHVAPRLGEAYFEQLKKSGLTLEEMYRNYNQHMPLYMLAECLLDFDEMAQLFRYQHLKLAQRIIGGEVMGTTGRPVDILRQRMEHVFYKPLWEVRNEITERANAARGTEMEGHGESHQGRY